MKLNKNDILKVEYIENVPIAEITSYKTEGQINGIFYPKTEKEIITSYNFLKENNLPFLIVGNGSNLLISPKTNIFVLSTKKLRQTAKINEKFAVFSASLTLSKAYTQCLKNCLEGFERLAGIPATIGGAIKNNASSFGASIFDNLESVRVFQKGKIKTLKKQDIEYSYHTTNLSDTLILSAKFKLNKESPCKITQEFVYYQKLRNEKQPKGFCCGSVFRNPPLLSAGVLIEQCNLKGKCFGDAEISNKHGNFIINKGFASFDDVVSLINLCKSTVREKFSIELQTEVEIIY